MRIVLRKTVRRMVMLLVAFTTFIVGFAAFYFYAEAASFLFKPKPSTPETTQTLTTQLAAPPLLPPTPAYPAPESQTGSGQPDCQNCIQDELCGLCQQLTGEYDNYTYSFAVTIPSELSAMRAPAPANDYGFIARLTSDPQATIEVEGSINESSWGSLKEALNAHIEYLRASANDVTVLKYNPTRLGKRAAIRYVVQYTSISTGLSMIEDKTLAIRKEAEQPKEYWTIYAVSLQTPATRYERNLAVLEKVLRFWKETEVHGC